MTELNLKADRRLSAERGRDTHFVLLGFRAPRLEKTGERPGVNLALVLDHSGSMGGGKLELAKRAAELALARLTPKDRFSLVVYDDRVEVLVASTPATPEALHGARLALSRVQAGGTTALFGGYVRGAEQVAAHLHDGELGKVLLMTDGLANVGLQDPATITKHVAELRSRGVHTSTFGVGAGFNQLLLEGMSDAGGGNFYFVERAEQLEDLLTSEVGEALETVARDVRVAVEHGPGVEVRLLDAFVLEPRTGGVTSRLGALTSEQVVELVYEVEVPGRPAGETTALRFSVSDADGLLGTATGTVEFRHATDAEVEAEEADTDVVMRAAKRVRLQAGEMAYAMQYMGRGREVRGEAAKALEYLRHLGRRSPLIQGLVTELERDVAEAEAPMDPMMAKLAYFERSRSRRGRDEHGRARKS